MVPSFFIIKKLLYLKNICITFALKQYEYI